MKKALGLFVMIITMFLAGCGGGGDGSHSITPQAINNTFGGTGSESAYSEQQTADGGFVLAGSTDSFGAGAADAYLVRTDGQGNKLWERTFGGTGYDYAYSVQQTADGGFVLAGSTDSLAQAVLTPTLSARMRRGTSYGRRPSAVPPTAAHSVQQTADGGFVLAGGAWLIRTDAQGNTLWEKDLRRQCFQC